MSSWLPYPHPPRPDPYFDRRNPFALLFGRAVNAAKQEDCMFTLHTFRNLPFLQLQREIHLEDHR
jgi:hypothetical protein